MGSTDIPPFLRKKLKDSIQKESTELPPFLKKKEEVSGEILETGSEETAPFSLRGMTALAAGVTGEITEPVSRNPYANTLSAMQGIDIPQEQKSLVYSEVTKGNVRPLVDIVKTEKDKVKQKKAELAQSSFSGGASSLIPISMNQATDIPADTDDDIKIKNIQSEAAKAIDYAAADKLLSLNLITQDKAKDIGKERRMLRSEIGEEIGFGDEVGDVAYVNRLKDKFVTGWMPWKLRINDEKVVEKHDFKNEMGVYGSAMQRLDEEIVKSINTEPVQAWVNATPEQREVMKNDPAIADFISKVDRFESLKNIAEQLPFKYPQVLRQLQKQKIADAWADKIHAEDEVAGLMPGLKELRQARKLVKGDKLDTDAEYQEIADRTGISKERVKEIAETQDIGGAIVIPSRLGRIWRSAVGVTQATSQGLNRMLLDKNKANVINREIQETIYQTPEVMTKKWTIDRVFDTMANGLGQFIGYVGTAGTVSAPASAIVGGVTKVPGIIGAVERAVNIGTTFGTGYASSLESAYQYAATQTDDESKRWGYARSVAAANGASELLLRDIDVASKILKGKSATNILRDISAVKTPFSAGNIFAARIAEVAKVMGYESVEELIPYFTEVLQKNNVFDYKTSTSEVLKGAFDTFIETAISTIPMGGFSATSVSSTKVMEAALLEAAKTPDEFKARFEKMFQDGNITEQDRDKNIQLVNTLQEIHPTIPSQIDGKEITEPQKASLLNSLLGQRQLNAYKKTVAAPFQAKVDEKISALDEQINNILTQKEETEVAAKEPVALTEAETAAIEGIKAKDFSGSIVKQYTDIIQDDARHDADKKEALKELSDQLTAKSTEVIVGEALGQQ